MISPPSKCLPNKELDWLNTWAEMERVHLANKDKVRAIGVRLFERDTGSDEMPIEHYRYPTSLSLT